MARGEKKERRPPQTQTQYFVAIAQADYTTHMDVVRWLMQDRQYLCISALHDKDTYTAEDIAKKGENGVYTRKNGDGSESQFREGDVKPPHYHLLIKTRSKLRPSSLEGRFCDTLHFEACSDRYEYACYLLHETFDSRNKFHYDTDALTFGGDVPEAARWYISMRDTDGDNTLNLVRRALAASTHTDGTTVSRRKMLENVLAQQDSELLRSMMAHTHFYDNFVLAPLASCEEVEE